MNRVGIVDYGVGNLGSITNILNKISCNFLITRNTEKLSNCDAIILPGVGSFKYAIQVVKKNNLDVFLTEYASKLKIIGICLGMHLLAESSTEDGFNSGIGLIKGKVVKLDQNFCHTGWNKLENISKNQSFKKFNNGYFYFNHSYHLTENEDVLFFTKYNQKIISFINKGNIYGFQFHPEKSQKIGELLLKSILN